GVYRFTVSAKGFGPVTGVEGVLGAGQSELQMDFTLSKGATVLGRVTESGSGKGAANVGVTLQGVEDYPGVKTDEQGYYVLAGLAPGVRMVKLDTSGSPYLPGAIEQVREVSIKDPDQEITGIDFVVEPAGVVWGYVTQQDKTPVVKVNVALCSSSSILAQVVNMAVQQKGPLNDTSGEDGYYELVGVPLNEEWRVYAQCDDWAPQLSEPFLLSGSLRELRVDVFLTEGTTIYGRVIDADKQPVPEARVVCIPKYTKFLERMDTAQAFRSPDSDEKGEFAIPELPRGEYQLMAFKENYKADILGLPVYPDGYQDIHDIELVLTAVDTGDSSVFGQVTDSEGKPVEGVTVTLRGVETAALSRVERKAQSDVSGNYLFSGVSQGILTLEAAKEGYSQKRVANVRLNEPTDIELEGQASVAGRVTVRETGAPPPSFTIQVFPMPDASNNSGGLLMRPQRGVSETFNGEDGQYSVTLSPGRYQVTALAPGFTPADLEVTLKPGEQRGNQDLEVKQRGGGIAGKVVTRDGKSPLGASVWYVRSGLTNAAPQQGRQVGADGAYEFAQLSPGAYDVFARVEGYAQGRVGPVEVGEEETVTGIDITLETGGTLTGFVAIDGQLQADAVVTVMGGSDLVRMTNTDANGQYTIDHLSAGQYLVTAQMLGKEILSGVLNPRLNRVQIVNGEVSEYNFGAQGGGTVRGYCSSPPPMTGAGFVLLRDPTFPLDWSQIDLQLLLNLASNLSTIPDFIEALEPVGRDGSFTVTNVQLGVFQLDIIYIDSPAGILEGGWQPVFSTSVAIESAEPIDLGQIAVNAP
ncbi:MAG: hypothetical protein QG656_438, partial [Candidatus Hydrogenedentes bacterium]|nr:hypothetical protein [Candidatus Hydrogenedentota bacterium]